MTQKSMIEGIECVTFDLDDTLWPIEPTISNAELKLYEWLQHNYPQVTSKYSSQDITAKRMAITTTRSDIAHNVTELRYYSLMEIAKEFGYSQQFADEGLALFRHYRNQVEPYDHSESILALMKERFRLGAITNGNAQLEHIPIGHYFDFVVTPAEAGVSKPAPEIFQFASKLANVELSKIVHIGDSAQTDVLGAMRAGCKAVWFNSKRQPWPGGQSPHHVIHCLSELLTVLNIHSDN